jgi:hypothetical protein
MEEMNMHRLAFAGLFACAALGFGASSATAIPLGFDCISGNVAGDCAIGEAQLEVEATAGPDADQVSFRFTNAGPADSSITAVYFDDDAGALLAIASILDGTGVDFEAGANPPNLPAGNNADPDFDNTGGLAADSEPPTQPNGVNPGEELTIVASLADGFTFADVEAALSDKSLRIGIHVQGFATEGSESFVNDGTVVPEPSLGLLLVAPALALVRRARQR